VNHIVDHKKENADPKNAFIWIRGQKYLRKTTKGRKRCLEWKRGTTSWVPLSTLEESNPVKIAEYAFANGLNDEPAFS
jgi:hypothetical protein